MSQRTEFPAYSTSLPPLLFSRKTQLDQENESSCVFSLENLQTNPSTKLVPNFIGNVFRIACFFDLQRIAS